MYAPSLVAPLLPRRFGPRAATGAGGILLMAGLAVFAFSRDVAAFSAAAILAGSGWSLVTLGTTLAMHRLVPSRLQLGMHDGALLMSALIGALAAGAWG
jgi:hypothetical protein